MSSKGDQARRDRKERERAKQALADVVDVDEWEYFWRFEEMRAETYDRHYDGSHCVWTVDLDHILLEAGTLTLRVEHDREYAAAAKAMLAAVGAFNLAHNEALR